MKRRNASSGAFTNQGASSADLERGFIADDSDIPDDGENVFHPESGKMKREMMEYMTEDKDERFEGGFLGRDQCGYDRY